MKKYTALFLSIIMLISIAACASESTVPQQASPAVTSETEATGDIVITDEIDLSPVIEGKASSRASENAAVVINGAFAANDDAVTLNGLWKCGLRQNISECREPVSRL